MKLPFRSILLVFALLALTMTVISTHASGSSMSVPGDASLTVYGRYGSTSPLSAGWFGFSVSHGNFNGDDNSTTGHHLEDVLITAPNVPDGGEAYVILGREDTSELFGADDCRDILVGSNYCEDGSGNDLGADYTIIGDDGDRLGYDYSTVSLGGDIDDDGYDEIVVPANGNSKIYVVKGRADLGWEDGEPFGCGDGVDNGDSDGADNADDECVLDLSDSETADLTVIGDSEGFTRDPLVRDINADGYGDLIITNFEGDGPPGDERTQAGEVYIIFGSDELFSLDPPEIDLSDPPEDVEITTVYGADDYDQMGEGNNARDVSGDGINDLLLGARFGDGPTNEDTDSGELYVILGSDDDPDQWPSEIDLADSTDLDNYVFIIYGADAGDEFGYTVYTGNADGDESTSGYPVNDIIAGSAYAVGPTSPASPSACDSDPTDGAAYVIYGGDFIAPGDSMVVDDEPGTNDGMMTIWAYPTNAIYIPVHFGLVSAEYDSSIEAPSFREDIIVSTGTAASGDATFIIQSTGREEGVRFLCEETDYDLKITAEAGDRTGFWLAAADLDGDGVSETITSSFIADGPGTGTSCNDGVGDRCNSGEVNIVFDADLDGVINGDDSNDDNDSWADTSDPCPVIGTIWITPSGDTDCDGFISSGSPSNALAAESQLGTDPDSHCPATPDANDEATDAWPPDLNDDRTVDDDDVAMIVAVAGQPAASYPRFDLKKDSATNINVADLLALSQFYGSTCMPRPVHH